MNIALGALLILLLLFPGIVFRISYLNVPYGRKTFTLNFTDELLFSFIPAFILQFIGYYVVSIGPTSANLGLIYRLLISDKPDATLYAGIQQSFLPFSLYCFVMYFVAFVAGWLSRRFVHATKLHQTSDLFRFNNDWYALLSGEIIEQKKHKNPEMDLQVKDIYYVLANILVDTKNESYMYTGILTDFILSKDEGLDRIYLTGTRCRKFNGDTKMPAKEEEFPKIEEVSNQIEKVSDPPSENHSLIRSIDNYFMIPYREIKNMNITYFIKTGKEEIVPENATPAEFPDKL